MLVSIFLLCFCSLTVLGQEPLQELPLRVLCNLVIAVAFVVGIKMYLSLTLSNSQYLIVNSPPLQFAYLLEKLQECGDRSR